MNITDIFCPPDLLKQIKLNDQINEESCAIVNLVKELIFSKDVYSSNHYAIEATRKIIPLLEPCEQRKILSAYLISEDEAAGLDPSWSHKACSVNWALDAFEDNNLNSLEFGSLGTFLDALSSFLELKNAV